MRLRVDPVGFSLGFFAARPAVMLPAGALPAQPLAQVDERRAWGYQVGDLLERGLRFELPAGQHLATEAWPRPGRASPWLELCALHLQQSGARVRVQLRDQS